MKNLLVTCLLFLCIGCSVELPDAEQQNTLFPEVNEDNLTTADRQLRQLIKRYGLSGQPESEIIIPDIQSPKAQLGKKLFFSRALSGELNVACASCHHPLLGGGDNLSLPIGINSERQDLLGVGRRHEGFLAPNIARNAPTTFNIALWKRNLFHDGRVERTSDGGITTPDVQYPETDPQAGSDLVQAQARFPITSDHEMRGTEFDKGGDRQSHREKLAERLGGYGTQKGEFSEQTTQYWLQEFRKAFNAPDGLPNTLITEQNISALLSEYQRSQLFVKNKWRDYISGNHEAISASAKKGALLFYRQTDEGGFGCVNCHGGDFFTNEQFYHTLMPPVGPGKTDKNGIPISNRDMGRSLVTGNITDRFKFRVPSLLNSEMTGPWGHNGAYTTLANIIRHMINPYQSATKYDYHQLMQSSVQIKRVRAGIGEMLACDVDIVGKDYSEAEVQALVAFLLTLTDPCVKERECMNPWLPDPKTDQDPMKLLLIGRDTSGKRL